jgi:hypothetical protein
MPGRTIKVKLTPEEFEFLESIKRVGKFRKLGSEETSRGMEDRSEQWAGG